MSENTDLKCSFKGPGEKIIEGSGYQRYGDGHWSAKRWPTFIGDGADKETTATKLAEKGCATKVACHISVGIIFFCFLKKFGVVKNDWKIF